MSMTHLHADAPRPARILVVEDDAKTAELVALYLAHAGRSVSTERSGSKAIERLVSETFDLLLLDIMLPGVSGLEIARRARETMETPIIFLSARTIEEDRLDGFAVGADDYVTKPFSPRELMARVEAVLRRSPPGGTPVLRYADLVIDHERHMALLAGSALDLTPSEFTVLAALVAHPGFVRSRAWLLERLPGEGSRALDRIVDVHVSNLRRKLVGGALGLRYIDTVVGVGYRVPVQETAGGR